MSRFWTLVCAMLPSMEALDWNRGDSCASGSFATPDGDFQLRNVLQITIL